ncbi:hypothetical protein Zmor_004739 [Zophobas morio]|uniref:Uncharacterized protein n=1 Tax=Zophobas morio TaxID=2755281 RepID=A0AA38IWI0_9CUCU|nr:hypothetical protein Zmor_004739 [Zophobas morio]
MSCSTHYRHRPSSKTETTSDHPINKIDDRNWPVAIVLADLSGIEVSNNGVDGHYGIFRGVTGPSANRACKFFAHTRHVFGPTG